MLHTISRAGRVLALFTAECPEWGATEVAASLEIPKSNAHDMLSSLATIGLLQRTHDGRYRLGWRLLTMSRSLIRGAGFERQAIVTALARKLGEACTLAAWDGARVVCLACVVGRSESCLPEVGVGVRLPGHSTALGKMVLAHRPKAELERSVERYGLPRLTDRTIEDEAAFFDQLRTIRDDRLSYDRGETYESVSCVAAPVRNAQSHVVAALSISVPVAQMETYGSAYSRAVTGAARRLSAMASAEAVQPLSPPPRGRAMAGLRPEKNYA